MDGQAERILDRHLVVINNPGANWSSPLPATAEMAQRHHAIYQSLLDDGLLISAGRLEGQPVMGISLFHKGVSAEQVRPLLDGDEFVTRGFLSLEYRYWDILTGALAGGTGTQQP